MPLKEKQLPRSPKPFERLFRWGEQNEQAILADLSNRKDKVKAMWKTYEDLTDAQLQEQSQALRVRIQEGATLESIQTEAFATFCEAAKRVLHKEPYDVQIMGALALHEGKLIEMDTGEGKTLVAAMAAYGKALAGEGVHVVTANEYLAKRDPEMMKLLYDFLDISVGVTVNGMPSDDKREAYACDITYGTGNEFGFDYLRDNRVYDPENKVQRGHRFAIVDEVDSILIDDAYTPLQIDGNPIELKARDLTWLPEFARLVSQMTPGSDYDTGDYKVDLTTREASPNLAGIERIEDQLGLAQGSLYDELHSPLIPYLYTALEAKEFFKRGETYVVKDGKIIPINQYTKRKQPGHRFRGGIHQAIEAKEGVEITPDREITATISLQKYFRLYGEGNLSGMSGTVKSEAEEFRKNYGLDVIRITPNKPRKRIDHPDKVYLTATEKWQAIIDDIVERHAKGQPILVGTVSAYDSEILAGWLQERGIEPMVLNAANDAREAEIIAQAGRKSAVTIATQMAGRGTDILLGGNPEYLARQQVDQMAERGETYGDMEAVYQSLLAKARLHTMANAEFVKKVGGLYVLGTERNISERIDNQLRGRSGRQGDPGETQFYLSLDDNIMDDQYTTDQINAKKTQYASKVANMQLVTDPKLHQFIVETQRIAQGLQADQREGVLKYDKILDGKRTAFYADRERILESETVEDDIYALIDDFVDTSIAETTKGIRSPQDWNLDALWGKIATMHRMTVTVDEFIAQNGGNRAKITTEILGTYLAEELMDDYETRRAQFVEQSGEERVTKDEKSGLLEVMDNHWSNYLSEIANIQAAMIFRGFTLNETLQENDYVWETTELHKTRFESYKGAFLTKLFNTPIPTNQTVAEE